MNDKQIKVYEIMKRFDEYISMIAEDPECPAYWRDVVLCEEVLNIVTEYYKIIGGGNNVSH